MFPDETDQLTLACHADCPIHHRSIFIQKHGRNALHPETMCQLWSIIDIDFTKPGAVSKFLGDVLKRGYHGYTGPAPGRPETHDLDAWPSDHCIKIRISQFWSHENIQKVRTGFTLPHIKMSIN